MKLLVTGGGGFVGKALVLRLLREGHNVTAFCRGEYPELTAAGVQLVRGDLSSDVDNLFSALEGCDGVFHTAAKVDMWGPFNGFYQTNVVGTKNVIEGCRKAGVSRLVFTSSPSVIASECDLAGVDESIPYPRRYLAYYPQTKAEAEELVLRANDSALHTISLRPHLIFGPGDRHFVPTILERARNGRMVRVGDGKNLVDLCFIDDCIEAHLGAFAALENNPTARGRAFFISQGDPVPLWDWIDEVLVLNGLPKLRRRVPAPVAYMLAAASEAVTPLIGAEAKPLFTRFLVSEMTTDHYFDISAARSELGYEPSCTVREALRKTFPPAPA